MDVRDGISQHWSYSRGVGVTNLRQPLCTDGDPTINGNEKARYI